MLSTLPASSLSPPYTLPAPFSSPLTQWAKPTALWRQPCNRKPTSPTQWPVRTWGTNSHIRQPWSGSSPNQALRWLQYHLTSFCFISVLFLPHHSACRILVPWPRIKLVTPGLGAWSHNHWTSRKYTSWHLNCSLWKAQSQETQLNCTWISDAWKLWDGKTVSDLVNH